MDLRESSQFLYMLAAESEHLVTITIFLPDEAKANFSRRLEEAFASDSYTDTARAWNAERLRVINETVEQHLLPAGAKWTREWLRDEVEDLMASRCGDTLREVSLMATLLALPLNLGPLSASMSPPIDHQRRPRGYLGCWQCLGVRVTLKKTP